MKDSSNRRCLELPDHHARVIHAVARASEHTGYPVMLLGAFARDVWLEYYHGITPIRQTGDIDFAVAVDGWDHYDRFRDYLLSEESFSENQDPLYPQRLGSLYGAVDILPFGGVGEQGEDTSDVVIRWPVDSTTMSIIGFQEAFDSAQTFVVHYNGGECEIRVLAVPSIAILKIIASSGKRGSYGSA